MAFTGVGTRSSPIALDDSEDEVYFELYKGSNHSSSSSLSVSLEQPLPPPKQWGRTTESQTPYWDKKRKRTHSFTSHDTPMAGPSAPQRNHTTLENRLSQPESKKARKRRRKAERQALEDTRLQNLNWLNGPSPFASGVPILPPRYWSSDVQIYGGCPPPHPADRASFEALLKSGMVTGLTPPSSAYPLLPEPEDFTLYDNRELHSVSPPPPPPPPPPSRWVSSMAKAAAGDPIGLTTEKHDERSQWSSLSTQALPPPLPPSIPPPLPRVTNAPTNPSRLNISTLPKPVEHHHALPPKPPPPQPAQTTIGMKPDQDPNSKHGVFQLASATKEAGTDVKKKGPFYMPNPARTLVMEQLPKTHRHPDFINNWSKTACGAHPVHIFIDGPSGKALIEFATAELARKAWASPKLGPMYVPQLKGKPREDLIKVWWYRVDGVGAGSGVGEIEEGEIEGDAVIEKDVDQPIRRETKKEKKARLAKQREEKRLKRELESRLNNEQHALEPLHAGVPTNSTSLFAAAGISCQRDSTPHFPSPPWSPVPATQHLPVAPDVSSWSPNPPRTLGDSWAESWGVPTWTIAGQADDLDDYERNMEIDEPRPPLRYPLHSSLPPRPVSRIVAPVTRVAVHGLPPPLPPPPSPPLTNLAPSSRPVYEASLPQVVPPPITRSSSSPSTLSPPSLPSEPRAMKNAPTEPSFTKRALLARQKELEERIAKSKLELAETRAAAGSASNPTTPVSTLQPVDNLIPVKPTMDLGEKQAMEDRLRKLVLQSQRARGKTGVAAPSTDNSNGASNVSTAMTAAPDDAPSISPSLSASSSLSSSSVPSPFVPFDQLSLPQVTTVSLSADNFSLEDLAVSFITQTIETIKSQPTSTPTQTISAYSSNKPIATATQSNSNITTKLELAAKQKRLEQHITESKNLMTKLAQARSKEEKDTILKAMREMTRSFEGSQSKMATSTATTEKTSVSQPQNPSFTPQGGPVRIWPGSHEDAGVLILSDSDSDSCESDED